MNVLLPPLHAGQREVARHPARYKVCACGRRWGKTRLGVVVGLAAALEGRRVWWIAPVFSQASIAWRLARPLAAAVPGAQVREADRVLRLPGGGELWCKSGDRPDLLRGEGLDLAVLDEAAYLPASLWTDVLRPALADRRGGALFLSTPRAERDWFHDAFARGQGSAAAWRSWAFPTWSSPHIDRAEIDAARAAMPDLVFRRELGAEFVSAAGARIRRAWLRYEVPPPGLTVGMGVDLAISERAGADYTACVVVGRARDGALWVLDAARDRLPFHQVVQFVQAVAAKWRPTRIHVEDVQYQRAVIQELLRCTSLPVRGVRPQGDKVARLAPLEARYEQGLVRHAPGLPGWFEDELLSFPVGSFDDGVDALVHAHGALDTSADRLAAAMERLDLDAADPFGARRRYG